MLLPNLFISALGDVVVLQPNGTTVNMGDSTPVPIPLKRKYRGG